MTDDVPATMNLDHLEHVSYSKRTCLEIIEELRSTTSKNEKIEILKRACHGSPDRPPNPAFIQVLYLTYCQRVKFGVKKIPDYETPRASALTMPNLLSRLQLLITRQVTGNRAIEFLAQTLGMATADDAKVIELIIGRDLRCGVNSGLINKVVTNLIPIHPIQLCTPYTKEALYAFPYPAYGQPKEDGMRCNWIYDRNQRTVEGYLRNGNPIPDTPIQIEQFVIAMANSADMSSFMIDGELLVLDEKFEKVLPRKTGNGILTKLIRETASKEEIARIVFKCWDIVPLEQFWAGSYNQPYHARLSILKQVVPRTPWTGVRPVLLLETTELATPEAAMAYYTELFESGKEGAIIKSPSGPWKNGRPDWQLKIKNESEMDLKVVGLTEGRGKYVGMLGNFVCESEDGDIAVEVGSGLSDSQRQEYWDQKYVGRIINVKYNEVIQSNNPEARKSLYLPIFIEVREDR